MKQHHLVAKLRKNEVVEIYCSITLGGVVSLHLKTGF